MIKVWTRAHPSGAPEDSTLRVVSGNVKKRLTMINTIAYYRTELTSAMNSFIKFYQVKPNNQGGKEDFSSE
jgi:hypothetical protein